MFTLDLLRPNITLSPFYRDHFLSTVGNPLKIKDYTYLIKMSSFSTPDDLYILNFYNATKLTNLNPNLS